MLLDCPVWSFRYKYAGPLFVVIRMSRSPSRSKSPQARPRPTFGDSKPPPAWPATSRDFPPPRFRKSCGGFVEDNLARGFFKGLSIRAFADPHSHPPTPSYLVHHTANPLSAP